MRKLLTAGAIVALAITGLVAAPASGTVPSTACSNNYPSYETETTVVNTVVHVAVQRHLSTSPTTVNLALCYSDTPSSSPSNTIGGYVQVVANNVSPGRWDVNVICEGDSPTMLASVNCNSRVSTTTTTSTTTSPAPSAGASVSGWTLVEDSTFTLGTTGANTGTVSTTSTNPTVTYGGTCTTVAGITPPVGTACSRAGVEAFVARGDATPGLATGTTNVCLVTVGSTCHVYLPKAGIVLFGDAANPTKVSVLGTTLFNDPGTTCIGIC